MLMNANAVYVKTWSVECWGLTLHKPWPMMEGCHMATYADGGCDLQYHPGNVRACSIHVLYSVGGKMFAQPSISPGFLFNQL